MSQRKKRRRPLGLQDGPDWACDCPSCLAGDTTAGLRGVGARFVNHVPTGNMTKARAARYPKPQPQEEN